MADNIYEENYTISEPTYNTVLKLTDIAPVVFRSFIYRLMIKNLQSNPIVKLELDETDISIVKHNENSGQFAPENFKVYLFKHIPDIQNVVSTKWSDVAGHNNENVVARLGTLANITEYTVNKNTYQETTQSQEELYNIPASGYIFTNGYSNSYIVRDWNYAPAFSKPPKESLINLEKQELDKTFNAEYWDANYGFSSSYDASEYLMYNVDKTLYPEEITVLSAGERTYNVQKNSNMVGAIMVAYCDETDETSLIDEEKDKKIIPAIYYDLHNAIKTINGSIRIVWNSYGILSVMSKI